MSEATESVLLSQCSPVLRLGHPFFTLRDMKETEMKTRLLSCCALGLFLMSGSPVNAKGPAYSSLKQVEGITDFQRQGEYVGEKKAVQVIARGNDKYEIVKYQGGLPGAGWDKSPVVTKNGNWEEIQSDLKGLKKIVRESPTLGMKAPEGATVLFDGTEETFSKHWTPESKMADKLLEQGAVSKTTMKDFKLHLEFLLPFMPEDKGQARGNSGCYIQGRYELQMLDSFGLKGADNECGGIYQAAAPSVNMCLPPLSWQTYDIDFTAAKFDETGKKVSNAIVTVKHNGVVIHDQLELPKQTPGGVLQTESAEPGPLFLQNHGDPVRYRNIWFVTK